MTNKELSRRIFDEIYSKGKVDLIPETHDEHVRLRDPSRDTILEGPESIRRYVESLRKGFPDFKMTAETQIAENDWVATQVLCHGTHKGTYMGMEPTKKNVNVRCLVFQRFRNNKVTEAEAMWDVLGLLYQLGLKPAEAIHDDMAATVPH
ncbi:MAG: hypothetical protein GWM90_12125 [Gemmatimonadetes bacterium]|nr:ester cyclase [Gemmatimonadota bacterium]NIQ54753.1 ester cyclase [Gemmatimonadota bacterium]NIU74962.1 hypothetical protein [Gammaproteobacteria bacterium]NIX44835.1 hypothetical protein [Gemmatimonadota bacterium]NIY09073.1 hypothetical protein [Gemmatimonadota bacterium]